MPAFRRLRPFPAASLVALVALLALAGCGGGGQGGAAWGWYVVSPWTATGRSNLLFLIGGLWDTILL